MTQKEHQITHQNELWKLGKIALNRCQTAWAPGHGPQGARAARNDGRILMPDRLRQCQGECQNRCQKECQIKCQTDSGPFRICIPYIISFQIFSQKLCQSKIQGGINQNKACVAFANVVFRLLNGNRKIELPDWKLKGLQNLSSSKYDCAIVANLQLR